MDYEKKYKEALELARKLYNMRGDWTNLEIESIFPELRKSEDEKIRKFLIQMAQNGHGEDKDWWNKCVAWLEKQGEHTDIPAEWSEEDERDFDVIRGIIYNSCNAEDASRLLTWFKAIKDRVQPKQEWSNWDKTIIESIEALCDEKIESVVFQDVKEYVNDIKDWLKSLRPQSTWKPSEEQLVALRIAIGDEQGSDCCDILRSLLKDLKSL